MHCMRLIVSLHIYIYAIYSNHEINKKNNFLNTHSFGAFCDSMFFAELLRYRHRSDENVRKLHDIRLLFVYFNRPHLHMCYDTFPHQYNDNGSTSAYKFLSISIVLYARHPRDKHYRILRPYDIICVSISSHIHQISDSLSTHSADRHSICHHPSQSRTPPLS
jgi:hypothetical protein